MKTKKLKKEINKPNPLKWSGRKKTIIIVGIVLLGMFLPSLSQAIDLSASGIAQAIIQGFARLVFSIVGFLVSLGAGFFEAMLNIGFARHQEVVEVGWKITRDFSNMFFILFMVVVAFATILRIEEYGIKKLLPKVIIIALLINFSLVISYVIIDITNITANFFIKTATQGGRSVSGTLVDSLNLTDVFLPADCEKQLKEQQEECKLYQDIKNDDKFNECITKSEEDRKKCQEAMAKIKQQSGGKEATFLNLIVSITLGSVVLAIAAFVLFAGGILLIIRLLFLWFLVIIVPFVFICYIMPGLKNNWQRWWKTFLSWAFFAPIYAFFIWLAIRISIEARMVSVKTMIESSVADQTMGIKFFSTGDYLINFLFIIGFLLGGLIAAKQLGIHGAGAALNIANKAKTGAQNWAKRTTMRPIKAVGTTVGAGALTAGGKLFGGKLGRRMEARGTQLRQAAMERPEHKKYAALFAAMSAPDRLKEVKTTKGPRGLIGAKQNLKDGLYRDADVADVKVAISKFRAFNELESLGKLKEIRPDAIDDKTEQEKTVNKVVQEGNLNKIPPVALEDERVVAAIAEFASAVQVESLRKTSPQHTTKLIATLDEITNPTNAGAMTALQINPLLDKIQHAHASQRGDISRMSIVQKISWAKNAGPEGLKRMDAFDPDIAVNIPPAQLKDVLEKIINPVVVKNIVAHLKVTPTAAAHTMATSDPWVSSLS